MEKKVYLLIEHSIDNWGVPYKRYFVCSTKEKADEKLKEHKNQSTEIVNTTIKEVTMYE